LKSKKRKDGKGDDENVKEYRWSEEGFERMLSLGLERDTGRNKKKSENNIPSSTPYFNSRGLPVSLHIGKGIYFRDLSSN
jgi:hypothetical protein